MFPLFTHDDQQEIENTVVIRLVTAQFLLIRSEQGVRQFPSFAYGGSKTPRSRTYFLLGLPKVYWRISPDRKERALYLHLEEV